MSVEPAAVHLPAAVPRLPDGWAWKRLDEVCDGVFDCPHSTPVLTEVGPYVVRSQDIRSGVFRAADAAHVSEETYRERVSRAEPRHGDLLYSREGTYFGIAAEVPRSTRLCLGQRMVLLRPRPSVADSRFLLYWLNSPAMASHVDGYRDGSVAERLNLSTIRGLPVAVPALEEQRATARILGTLDDKIDLNRRMSETLEAMARALFQSWFVDFDPVRAKAEGRDPGLPKAIADLFPGRLVGSELGEIPEGWEILSLGDLCPVITDGAHSSPPSVQRGRPMASVKDLTNWRIAIEGCRHVSERDFEELVRNGCQPEQGDILLAKDGASLLETACEYRQPDELVLLSSVAILRPVSQAMSAYLHTWLSLRSTKSYLREGFASGSAIPRVVLKDLKRARVVAPPPRLTHWYADLVAPVRERTRRSLEESSKLARLRDALLPRLMSGALRPTSKVLTPGARG